MSALEVLQKARELIAKPGGWTQGAYARTADGFLISERNDNASCFCSVGAVSRSSDISEDIGSAFDFLHNAMPPRFTAAGIIGFNDSPDTTQADVVALFDRAIKLAEAA
jgi:hypothetical protein